MTDSDSSLNVKIDKLIREFNNEQNKRIKTERILNERVRILEKSLFYLVFFLTIIKLDSTNYFDPYGVYGLWLGTALFLFSIFNLFFNFMPIATSVVSEYTPVFHEYKKKNPSVIAVIIILIASVIAIRFFMNIFEIELNDLGIPILVLALSMIGSSYKKIETFIKRK